MQYFGSRSLHISSFIRSTSIFRSRAPSVQKKFQALAEGLNSLSASEKVRIWPSYFTCSLHLQSWPRCFILVKVRDLLPVCQTCLLICFCQQLNILLVLCKCTCITKIDQQLMYCMLELDQCCSVNCVKEIRNYVFYQHGK